MIDPALHSRKYLFIALFHFGRINSVFTVSYAVMVVLPNYIIQKRIKAQPDFSAKQKSRFDDNSCDRAKFFLCDLPMSHNTMKSIMKLSKYFYSFIE